MDSDCPAEEKHELSEFFSKSAEKGKGRSNIIRKNTNQFNSILFSLLNKSSAYENELGSLLLGQLKSLIKSKQGILLDFAKYFTEGVNET